MTFKTADLCDQYGAELQILEPGFRSYGGRRRFAGPASTVKCHEDNSRVREAVGEPGRGRVLVVEAGEIGCVRDAADLAGFDLGVLALATLPRRSERKGAGQRDVPVEFAGARIRPGDYVYADEDGVIVAPRALLP
jgi:regulator of ribonuclease activity A